MNCHFQQISLIGTMGTPELLFISGILLLLFGGKKIPQLAKGLARSLVEFKKGRNDCTRESEKNDQPTKKS